MVRASAILVMCCAAAASAQTAEEEWTAVPAKVEAPRPTPPPSTTVDGLPLPPLPSPADTAPTVAPPPPPIPVIRRAPMARVGVPVLLPNQTNMTGAATLGAGKRGQLFLAGFPLIELRGLFGVARWLDLGVSFQTVYFTSYEFRGIARVGLVQAPTVQFGLSFEAGGALFVTPASRESFGARWLSGHRNFNLTPGALVTFQTTDARAAKVSLEGRYHLSFDTEPFAVSPLGGVPGKVVLGHSVLARVSVEVPISSATAFVVQGGLDFRLRPDEAPVYPTLSVGLVTSL